VLLLVYHKNIKIANTVFDSLCFLNRTAGQILDFDWVFWFHEKLSTAHSHLTHLWRRPRKSSIPRAASSCTCAHYAFVYQPFLTILKSKKPKIFFSQTIKRNLSLALGLLSSARLKFWGRLLSAAFHQRG